MPGEAALPCCKEFDFTTREQITLSSNESTYQISGNRHAEYFCDVTANDVKVSYLKTDMEQHSSDALILINSTKKDAAGTINLDRSYNECHTILGNPSILLKNCMLNFKLNADESCVIRLER